MSRLHQIALTFIKNIGPVSAKALLTAFGDAEHLFNVPKSKWLKVPGIGEWTLEGAGSSLRPCTFKGRRGALNLSGRIISTLFFIR